MNVSGCVCLSVFMDLNENGKVFAPGDLVNPSHQPVSRGALISEEQRRARVYGEWGIQRLHGGRWQQQTLVISLSHTCMSVRTHGPSTIKLHLYIGGNSCV